MRIIYNLKKNNNTFVRPVVAIGIYDGVHRGHRRVIALMRRRAAAMRGTSMVMTFFPHPAQVVRSRREFPLLVSLPHRLRLIESTGVDACIVVSFTEQFSRMQPEKFVADYLAKRLRPQHVFVGENFRFGKDRQGTAALLAALGATYGFAVTVVPAYTSGTAPISSTRIRRLIAAGKLAAAKYLLGRPVSIFGNVIKGAGRGKRLGFPTVNVNPAGKVVPPCGIYAARVIIGKKRFAAMAYIGRRPSFKDTDAMVIEAHLFHFDKNIYGRNIEIQFIKKIRNDKVFSSQARLAAQLKRDKKAAQKVLTNHG